MPALNPQPTPTKACILIFKRVYRRTVWCSGYCIWCHNLFSTFSQPKSPYCPFRHTGFSAEIHSLICRTLRWKDNEGEKTANLPVAFHHLLYLNYLLKIITKQHKSALTLQPTGFRDRRKLNLGITDQKSFTQTFTEGAEDLTSKK